MLYLRGIDSLGGCNGEEASGSSLLFLRPLKRPTVFGNFAPLKWSDPTRHCSRPFFHHIRRQGGEVTNLDKTRSQNHLTPVRVRARHFLKAFHGQGISPAPLDGSGGRSMLSVSNRRRRHMGTFYFFVFWVFCFYLSSIGWTGRDSFCRRLQSAQALWLFPWSKRQRVLFTFGATLAPLAISLPRGKVE